MEFSHPATNEAYRVIEQSTNDCAYQIINIILIYYIDIIVTTIVKLDA
jgi:hypothetical protein